MDSICERIHISGIDRLTGRNGIVTRCIWSTLLAAATAFMIYHIHNRLQYFQSNPTMANIDIVYANEMQFPTVTICSSVHLLPKRYASTQDKLLYRYLADQQKGSKQASELLKNDVNMSAVDYVDFIHRHRVPLEELIPNCKWQHSTCDMAQQFTSLHTDYGPCHTFNMNGANMVNKTGKRAGLSLTLQLPQSYDYIGSQEEVGFRIAIHENHEVASIERDSLLVTMGQQMDVAISKTVIKYLEAPIGECGKKKLQFFAEYTTSSCIMECAAQLAVRNCTCRPLYMPGEGNVCNKFDITAEQQRCVHRIVDQYVDQGLAQQDENCVCPNNCEESVFDIRINTNGLQNINDAAHVERRARVNIYLRDHLHYTLIKHELAYSGLALLADIGGAMGLMMGCCFFTMAECLDVLMNTIWRRLQQRNAASRSHGNGLSERQLSPLGTEKLIDWYKPRINTTLQSRQLLSTQSAPNVLHIHRYPTSHL